MGLRWMPTIIETGLVRDSHPLLVLLGFGATAVYPYLVYNVIADFSR